MAGLYGGSLSQIILFLQGQLVSACSLHPFSPMQSKYLDIEIVFSVECLFHIACAHPGIYRQRTLFMLLSYIADP
jgi:hypothetical protein